MTTQAVVQQYLNALANRAQWSELFAQSMTFTSFTSPVKEISGRDAFVKATARFYESIVSMEVRTLIVDGPQACALTRYRLRSPSGDLFSSDVAEIFHVTQGQIDSFAIYFDTAPFPR